jgi:alpha-beta hydrolase superfamily lysophospholipase
MPMPNQSMYKSDVCIAGFEQLTIKQANDFEGEVVCTLVRKKTYSVSSKAVLYIHGFNDYFFNAEVALNFVENGYNFYALDLRKSGRSWLPHQKLNNLRDVGEYFDDISAAIDIIESEANTQLLLYGHSMGGLVAALYAMKNSDSKIIKALFLNSPFFEMNENLLTLKILVPMASWVGKFFPNLPIPGRFSRFYGPSLHANNHGEWNYNLNWKPHLMPFVNLGWIRAIYRGQKQIWQGIKLQIPTLVVYPEKTVSGRKWKNDFKHGDAILNVERINYHAVKIVGDCQLFAIENAVHDVMLSQKRSREKARNVLFAWLKCHF